MKIKIKKNKKVKEFDLIKTWADVNVDSYSKLITFCNGTKSSEALETIAELSNVPKDLLNQLELKHIAIIMSKISELQARQSTTLKRVIEVDDVRYGFHPDLDAITLGEYADLEHFIKLGTANHLPEIMAVLYRPISHEDGELYTIKAYDGDIKERTEVMRKLSAEEVQNALVFFYHLGSVLLLTTQSSLMETLKAMKEQLPQNPLRKSGATLV